MPFSLEQNLDAATPLPAIEPLISNTIQAKNVQIHETICRTIQ